MPSPRCCGRTIICRETLTLPPKTFKSANTGYEYAYQPYRASDGSNTFWAQVEQIRGINANNCRSTDSLGSFDVMRCAFDKLMEFGYFPKA